MQPPSCSLETSCFAPLVPARREQPLVALLGFGPSACQGEILLWVTGGGWKSLAGREGTKGLHGWGWRELQLRVTPAPCLPKIPGERRGVGTSLLCLHPSPWGNRDLLCLIFHVSVSGRRWRRPRSHQPFAVAKGKGLLLAFGQSIAPSLTSHQGWSRGRGAWKPSPSCRGRFLDPPAPSSIPRWASSISPIQQAPSVLLGLQPFFMHVPSSPG